MERLSYITKPLEEEVLASCWISKLCYTIKNGPISFSFIIIYYFASMFPKLASFPHIFVPPTKDTVRDARISGKGKSDKERCFIKLCLFLMTVSSDHSWSSCQSAFIVVGILIELVCVNTFSNPVIRYQRHARLSYILATV